jgi:hypothetical protein
MAAIRGAAASAASAAAAWAAAAAEWWAASAVRASALSSAPVSCAYAFCKCGALLAGSSESMARPSGDATRALADRFVPAPTPQLLLLLKSGDESDASAASAPPSAVENDASPPSGLPKDPP